MNDKEAKEYGTLISIIIPAYGVEKYIEKCLDSVIEQTYKNLEIIVVDDGTKDRSGEIAEDYSRRDNRIVVFHKSNGGLSDARNYGIKHARGQYITCIDSDDYVDSDYVEYMYNIIQHYSARIAFCQHRVHFPSGNIKDYGNQGSELIKTEQCLERIMYDDILNTSAWAKLYEKDLFNTVEYPKGMLFEDIGTTYKLLLQCDTIAIGYESKYNYILRENSIVTGSFNEKKMDLLVMTDTMAKSVQSIYPDLSDALLRRRVYARFSTLNQVIGTKGYNKQKKEMIRFIKDNSKSILRNPKVPKRDKFAIYLLFLGYPVYQIVWRLYFKSR